MKNSPHRAKHQVNKAVRQSKSTHPLPQKRSPEKKTQDIMLKRNWLVMLEDHLKPVNKARSEEILVFFKKHFERVRHLGPRHSKRANPGMVEGDVPFTHIHHHKSFVTERHNDHGLAKSRAVARKAIKSHKFRKVA